MKKIVGIFIVLSLLISCQNKINSNELTKINGYWEIEKVVFDQGEEKKYTVNEYFDYFELNNRKGIRKKVKPQLNGTYLVNDSFENLSVRIENEKVYIDYSSDYSKWTEEIIAISDEKLVLRNTENTSYHYKKATAINISSDGKKNK